VYQLTGVTKLYQKGRHTVRAVNGLDLTIGDGEWLAVQGRTGHGKSTLLNLLGGLDRPTEGTIELDGTDLGAQAETQLTRLRAQLMGFIFQTFNLIPTLSAAENVETALIPLGISGAGRRTRIAAALNAVGLADRAGHLPTELSGGQQQRVAAGTTLARTRPDPGPGHPRHLHRPPRAAHRHHERRPANHSRGHRPRPAHRVTRAGLGVRHK
jgi:putative ABC transport system ATP-binding protein